jgi:hypothetical protein
MRPVLSIFLVVLVTLLAVFVYLNGAEINKLLESDIADRVLLVLLIAVDGSVPFLSVGWISANRKKRNPISGFSQVGSV